MQNTKEHILRTSLILFLQKSYKDVTMSEIVKKTGLSKGAFYHYFTGKEALFKEIAMMFFTMGGIDYSNFSKTSLKAFYLQYIDFLDNSLLEMNRMVQDSDKHATNINYFFILFEAARRFPEFLKMELAFHKEDMEAWKSIIASARQNKEIKSHSTDEDIANLFLYCTDGVFIRFINNDKQDSFKTYLIHTYNTIYENLKV